MIFRRVNNHIPVIACAGFGASVEEKAESIKVRDYIRL